MENDSKWIISSLSEIANIYGGGTPKRSVKEYWNGNIPWVKIADMKTLQINSSSEFISDQGLLNSSVKLMPIGTILFSIFASIGKVGILEIEATTNQAIAGIQPIKKELTRFIIYSLMELSEQFKLEGKGVAQKNINLTILRNHPFPLPPLREQKRIVAKLDSLFGQMEKIKASLEKIPALLKAFRESVLSQAVSGELTEGKNWSANNIGGLLLSGIKNGIYKPQTDYGSGTRIARIDSFYNGKLEDITTLKQVQVSEDEIEQYNLKKDDFLINRVNSIQYLGKCLHVEELSEPCIFESNMMRLTFDTTKVNPSFMRIYFNSGLGLTRLRSNAKHAVNQASINQTDVRNVDVPIPPFIEQKEIVRRVESLFAKADAITARYKALSEKVEHLPQAILAQAFRGELVPQLPGDGDARELLEEIKRVREELGKGKKKAKKKK